MCSIHMAGQLILGISNWVKKILSLGDKASQIEFSMIQNWLATNSESDLSPIWNPTKKSDSN